MPPVGPIKRRDLMAGLEGLKHELGPIQRIDLLHARQGTKGPSRVAAVNSRQTLAQKAPAAALQLDELLRTDGG